MKLRLKYFDCEFECDASDDAVTQYAVEFRALAEIHNRALAEFQRNRAIANNRMRAAVEKCNAVKDSLISLEYSLKLLQEPTS